MTPLLEPCESGLYCATGDFYIDPSRGVERALITHAHSDHARPGSRAYLCSRTGAAVLRQRLGAAARIESLPFGETVELNGVRVSFHPAGHILGSAQIRLEWRGEVWVCSGDYKTQPDPTCEAFEPVHCHVFITESTFGLPVYQWRPPAVVFGAINDWWRSNRAQRRTSVLLGYPLGKAQRLLGGVEPALGPILIHSAVERFLPAYAAAGVRLPPVALATTAALRAAAGTALVVAPSAADLASVREARGETSTAFASGWMQLRRARQGRGLDRGFALSDHADWTGLLDAIRATGATRIQVTHGYAAVLVRWLREQGYDAHTLAPGEPSQPGRET